MCGKAKTHLLRLQRRQAVEIGQPGRLPQVPRQQHLLVRRRQEAVRASRSRLRRQAVGTLRSRSGRPLHQDMRLLLH